MLLIKQHIYAAILSGQVLKSFRDRPTDFSVYDRSSGTDAYLNTLGPMEIPVKGSRIGIENTHAPAMTIPIQDAEGSPVGLSESIAPIPSK